MNAIVYTSNTGFTEKYAKMLSEKINVPAYTLTDAVNKLKPNNDIIYMGWLMAGDVKGLKKAMNSYNVKALCGVGMGAMPGDKQIKDIQNRFKTGDTKVFYLQGGFNYNKLHGFYKFMMGFMKKNADKSISEGNKTPEEIEMFKIVRDGKDCTKPENLKEIIEWYNKMC